MGGLVSSIYDLIQGDPAKKQENQLESIGQYDIGTGEGLITPAAKYYEDILSGDPTRTAQALAPEISTQQQQVQQSQNELAQFAPRSGGTAAASADAATKARGNIINLEGGLQQGAAGAAGSLGSNLLSSATPNIEDVANLRTKRQQQSAGDWGQIGQAVAEAATMGLAGAGGGADPFETLYNAQHPDRSGIQTSEDTSLDSMQI